MTIPVNQEKVIEALIAMNTAAINLRLYPPTNAIITKTIDRLYETFMTLFQEEGSVMIAEAEKNMLISGEPLSQKHLGRPQVAIFLALMINWSIKSLTFVKGLEKNELIIFLEVISKKPDELKSKGGLAQIISEGKMPHILFNQKIYVAKDQDHQIVASLEIKDEDIVKYITSDDPHVAIDTQKAKEMAKDPEWVARIFQSGMQNIIAKDGTASKVKLSEGMLHMLRLLDEISEHSDKEKISRLIAGAIGNMDDDLIAVTLTQNIESLLENRLFDDIIKSMDFKKFETMAGNIQLTLNKLISTKGADDLRAARIQQTYRHVMSTDKGIDLQRRIQERQTREEEEKKRKIIHLKETSSNILNSLEKNIQLDNVSKTSPVIVQDLFSEGEDETAETIIERLGNGLISDNINTRAEVSDALARILDDLPLEKKKDILAKLSNKLIDWIKFETKSSTAYGSICKHLGDFARGWILDKRLADVYPIIETFRLINSGQIQKSEDIRSAASDTLRGIASDDILDFLIEEFRTNKENMRSEVGQILVMLSEYSINRLLYLLGESDDSSERVLILNLIPEMGPSAAPAVLDMIRQDPPWYFLRNLVRLLGRIGGEEHAKFLSQFLAHDDHRVQREALKSISSIGGSHRGEILLDALTKCDDRIKANIVITLGSLKYRDAVKPLMMLFKSKIMAPEEVKVDIQEKICLALGHIGDREALPFLTEIGKHSGILSLKTYHPAVKAAAGKAVGWIMSKS